jgi:elongation factor Ts
MGFTMETIKQLRELSGAGITDCQKALAEAAGDIDKAMDVLRRQGIAKAAKRTERKTAEGLIITGVGPDGREGYILEARAETDFVVRSEKFRAFVDNIFTVLKEKQPANSSELLNSNLGNRTVTEELEILSGVIGEKLELKNCAVVKTDGTIGAYTHMNGRIGTVVALSEAGQTGLANDVAMQIAATNPLYISSADVPAAEIEKEKAIYRAQLEREGKPIQIQEKIIAGKLQKYFEEICLIEQEYIKDDKKRVKDILGPVKVEKFVRFSL